MEKKLTRTYLKPKVLSHSDTLLIEEITEEYLPKEKFVRGRDKILKFERKLISKHKINVPFEVVEEKRTKRTLASGYFQTDDMYIDKEWMLTIKTYKEPELANFIESVMKSSPTT